MRSLVVRSGVVYGDTCRRSTCEPEKSTKERLLLSAHWLTRLSQRRTYCVRKYIITRVFGHHASAVFHSDRPLLSLNVSHRRYFTNSSTSPDP